MIRLTAYLKSYTTTVAGLCLSFYFPWWIPVCVKNDAHPAVLAPLISALGLSPTIKKVHYYLNYEYIFYLIIFYTNLNAFNYGLPKCICYKLKLYF